MKKTFLLSLMAAGVLVGFNADSYDAGMRHCFIHFKFDRIVPITMQCPRLTHDKYGNTNATWIAKEEHVHSSDCWSSYVSEDGH